MTKKINKGLIVCTVGGQFWYIKHQILVAIKDNETILQ